jgi:hypothetical protein
VSRRDDRELKKWAKRAVHGLDESALFAGVLNSPTGDERWEFALQLGHCLLTEKPIVLAAPHGAHVPERLAAAADRVVRYDPNNLESLQVAMTQALTELGINSQ